MNFEGKLLDASFYQRDNVVLIAKQLLGKVLVTRFDETITAGRIAETEAYRGRDDKACHAHGKRTPRTEIMYQEGGKAYVFLCYGIHHLFNVVTNKEGIADAVLIRAVEPLAGIETMKDRRNVHRMNKKLTGGPGILAQAMGITRQNTGEDLRCAKINIFDDQFPVLEHEIVSTTRIGVDYAEEDALKPWRFYIDGNEFVSKKVKP